VSGSMGGDASCDEGALPEDLELLGFEPMRSRHYWHVSVFGLWQCTLPRFAVLHAAPHFCTSSLLCS
jgi:hypothetical protein